MTAPSSAAAARLGLGSPLPASFYSGDALDVARALLGKILRRGPVVLRITEVEAYRWPGDSANHCRFGPTERNAAMWGPPGRAYVYLCYGLHNMLNIVTGARGEGAAVLIRACEPLAGEALVAERRGGRRGPGSLAGPGKVGQALAVDPSWSHHPLHRRGGLTCHDAPPIAEDAVLAGPRVGIDFAEPDDRAAPWRLALAGTRWISQPAGLRPRLARAR
ncbi:MAG: DNA-3-methyladenine glycosylase [Myxococcales bacterium]|nr:DNA-3-methyladenine glycosylase [Myxococcales bacterium]